MYVLEDVISLYCTLFGWQLISHKKYYLEQFEIEHMLETK